MVKKLVLGCGREPKKGWVNSDIYNKEARIKFFEEKTKEGYEFVEVDTTKKFPFEDGEFDFVYSEHMLEHLHEKDGLNCLKECLRVLKDDGVIRTVAPNLEFFQRLPGNDKHPFVEAYAKKIYKRIPNRGDAERIAHRTLNEQGHHWVPNIEMLVKQHQKAGFRNVEQVSYGKSEYADLNGIDLDDGVRVYESIVVEGVKAWWN